MLDMNHLTTLNTQEIKPKINKKKEVSPTSVPSKLFSSSATSSIYNSPTLGGMLNITPPTEKKENILPKEEVKEINVKNTTATGLKMWKQKRNEKKEEIGKEVMSERRKEEKIKRREKRKEITESLDLKDTVYANQRKAIGVQRKKKIGGEELNISTSRKGEEKENGKSVAISITTTIELPSSLEQRKAQVINDLKREISETKEQMEEMQKNIKEIVEQAGKNTWKHMEEREKIHYLLYEGHGKTFELPIKRKMKIGACDKNEMFLNIEMVRRMGKDVVMGSIKKVTQERLDDPLEFKQHEDLLDNVEKHIRILLYLLEQLEISTTVEERVAFLNEIRNQYKGIGYVVCYHGTTLFEGMRNRSILEKSAPLYYYFIYCGDLMTACMQSNIAGFLKETADRSRYLKG